MCTFTNDKDAKTCAICNAPKPKESGINKNLFILIGAAQDWNSQVPQYLPSKLSENIDEGIYNMPDNSDIWVFDKTGYVEDSEHHNQEEDEEGKTLDEYLKELKPDGNNIHNNMFSNEITNEQVDFSNYNRIFIISYTHEAWIEDLNTPKINFDLPANTINIYYGHSPGGLDLNDLANNPNCKLEDNILLINTTNFYHYILGKITNNMSRSINFSEIAELFDIYIKDIIEFFHKLNSDCDVLKHIWIKMLDNYIEITGFIDTQAKNNRIEGVNNEFVKYYIGKDQKGNHLTKLKFTNVYFNFLNEERIIRIL